MTTAGSARSKQVGCSPPWCATGDGLAPALSDVRRFTHHWEKEASVELRVGSPDAIDTYAAHGRIDEGDRDEMLEALYRGWKEDTEAGRTSLMIAGDLGSVSELNARARADRIAAGEVARARVGRGRRRDGRGGRQGGHPPERPASLHRPRLGPQRRSVDRHFHP